MTSRVVKLSKENLAGAIAEFLQRYGYVGSQQYVAKMNLPFLDPEEDYVEIEIKLEKDVNNAKNDFYSFAVSESHHDQ